ncbi:MAG: hydrogenase maturation nickel metallochaperone HypA [Alphaproteobacteria bacterium]|nr:hydrogenase maturation nickel metallochaperone HypA [Alphaproteobacteria bacterium]
MHEASLMSKLLSRVDAVARAEGAPRVTALSVWLGALSHFSAEHFVEHFGRASRDTIAEGAQLRVTVSADPAHPNAQDVLIESVEVEA